MLQTLQQNSGFISDEVSWSEFMKTAKYLIPKTMENKMILLLKAIAPQGLTDE